MLSMDDVPDPGRERRGARASRRAPAGPRSLATAPKEVWSWDIRKLKGPAKLGYFYLFVIARRPSQGRCAGGRAQLKLFCEMKLSNG